MIISRFVVKVVRGIIMNVGASIASGSSGIPKISGLEN